MTLLKSFPYQKYSKTQNCNFFYVQVFLNLDLGYMLCVFLIQCFVFPKEGTHIILSFPNGSTLGFLPRTVFPTKEHMPVGSLVGLRDLSRLEDF